MVMFGRKWASRELCYLYDEESTFLSEGGAAATLEVGGGGSSLDDVVRQTGTLGPVFPTRGVGYLYNKARTREIVFPLRLHAAQVAALNEGDAVEFAVNGRGMVTHIAPLTA